MTGLDSACNWASKIRIKELDTAGQPQLNGLTSGWISVSETAFHECNTTTRSTALALVDSRPCSQYLILIPHELVSRRPILYFPTILQWLLTRVSNWAFSHRYGLGVNTSQLPWVTSWACVMESLVKSYTKNRFLPEGIRKSKR